jgi:hypothetical protein
MVKAVRHAIKTFLTPSQSAVRGVTLVVTATQMRVAPICLDAYRLILQESKTVSVSIDRVFNNLVFIKLFSGKKKEGTFRLSNL